MSKPKAKTATTKAEPTPPPTPDALPPPKREPLWNVKRAEMPKPAEAKPAEAKPAKPEKRALTAEAQTLVARFRATVGNSSNETLERARKALQSLKSTPKDPKALQEYAAAMQPLSASERISLLNEKTK